jgi:predicted dehydrogenase
MNSSGELVNIGYIGYGAHCQQSHAPFLDELPLANVVGIAERSPAQLTYAASKEYVADGIVTTDHRDLLGSSAIDAVVITTGDSSHFSLAREAIEAGKHVMVEKPAAATYEELTQLPALFRTAQENGLQLWVCHPREFGPGPWADAAHYIHHPELLSSRVGAGPLGKVQELRYDCQYTLPAQKHELHASFADDKLNHTIVSVMRALPEVIGFKNSVLLDNGPTHFDARLVTVSDVEATDSITIRASGRRSAHKEHHDKGVFRDWIEAVFEEGVLRVEPSLGSMQLTYGTKELEPVPYDTRNLYNDMFGAFNSEFLASIRGSSEDPLSLRVKTLGTAAALLMQRPGFNGIISESALQRNEKTWLSRIIAMMRRA